MDEKVFSVASPTCGRQTDRPHYSTCSNRPHLASVVMRPNKITSAQRILTRPHRRVDFSLGKFNVTLSCFCSWPIGTLVNSMREIRTTWPLRTVLGGMQENPDVTHSKVPLCGWTWSPSWAHPSPHPNWLSRVCRAHGQNEKPRYLAVAIDHIQVVLSCGLITTMHPVSR